LLFHGQKKPLFWAIDPARLLLVDRYALFYETANFEYGVCVTPKPGVG
jgi:hypothetical protein